MNDDNELKARIEDLEQSKRMKAVIDKEIKELEEELKELSRWVD